MKLFLAVIVAILLMQACAGDSPTVSDAIASHSLTSMGREANEISMDKKHHPRQINCNYACARRCGKASRKKVCHRACKTCCVQCHCVPPGTYGHKGACPCYAKLKTHGNRPKCP